MTKASTSHRRLIGKEHREKLPTFTETLRNFPVNILATDPTLTETAHDLVADVDILTVSEIPQQLISRLAEEQITHIVIVDVESEEDFPHLTGILRVKSALAVAATDGNDKATIENDLIQQGHSIDEVQKAIDNVTAKQIPYFIVRTTDDELAAKLRSIGGIDSVITSQDNIQPHLLAAKDAAFNRSRFPAQTEELVEQLKRRQEHVNLRSLERISADLRLSLTYVLEGIRMFNEKTGHLPRYILEAGVGEGRIAIPLVLLGFNVIGIDAATTRLDSAVKRLQEATTALTKRAIPDDSLVDEVLRVAPELEIDTEQLLQSNEVEQALTRFHPIEMGIQELDKRSLHAMANQPEMIILAWNTLNFIGGPDQMLRTLNHLYNTLPKGGVLYIEVPNPKDEPYASMLAEYYYKHPSNPPGFFRAKAQHHGNQLYKEDDDGFGALRYYPNADELSMLLQLAGFSVEKIARERIIPKSKELQTNTISELFIIATRQ